MNDLQEMSDGTIDIDTPRGDAIGLTRHKFIYGSYLCKSSDYIYISFIASAKRGNFRVLVKRILDSGLGVKVPTPLARMEQIVRKAGYTHTIETDEMYGQVEVWVLEPSSSQKR